MAEGFIKSLKLKDGYGFVAVRHGPEVFFHATELQGLEFCEQLRDRRVACDVVSDSPKSRAINVRGLD